MKKLLLALVLSFGAVSLFAQYTPTTVFTEDTGNTFQAVATSFTAFADIDHDGDQDLLITGGNGPTNYAKLYKNDGAGIFTEVSGTPFTGVFYSCAAFADVNGDTHLDVIISGLTSSTTYNTQLYLNDGSGNFTADTQNTFDPLGYCNIKFGDIDGDNDMDFVMNGKRSDALHTYIYVNDGTGVFSPSPSNVNIKGTHSGELGFFDLNGDNHIDLLITGGSSLSSTASTVRSYLNDGSGAFSSDLTNTWTSVYLSYLDTLDIDGDNDLDIIITGRNTATYNTYVYKNNGSGVYTIDNGYSFRKVNEGPVKVVDTNNDGFDDIIISGNDGVDRIPVIYENDGTNNYVAVTPNQLASSRRGSLSVADVNNDNLIDIILTGQDASFLAFSKLYLNGSSLDILENNFGKNFNLYPNPTTDGKFNIDLGENYKSISVIVTDLSGKAIQSKEFNNSNIIKMEIEQPNGVYLIQLVSGKQKAVIKFIKNN